MKQYSETFPAALLSFPLNLTRRAFVVRSMWVVNNTAAVLYLTSMGTPGPGAGQQVPPYTALPIPDWNSSDVMIASNGSPLRDTDSLSLTYFDGAAPGMPSVQLSQPNYYDKPNPVDYVFNSGDLSTLGTVAPFGPVALGSYTVPVNRKASIESVSLMLIHQTAGAGNAGVDRVYVDVRPPNLAAATVAIVALAAATVGQDTASYGQSGMLNEGSVLTLGAEFDSAGATVNYYVSVRVKEFDA